MYVKAQSEHKYLLKLVLSGIHLKILGAYAIKYLVIKLCEDSLAFHTSFIRVLDRVEGGLAPSPLPLHRTYGSVYGATLRHGFK